MNDELKPCPFCGTKSVLLRKADDTFWFIECRACQSEFTVKRSVRRGVPLSNEKEVVETWNRRTAPEARVLTLDELWDCGDNEPVYLEYKLPNENIIKPAIFQPECSTFTPEGDDYMCVTSAWRASGFYSQSEYGKTWRCWSARPNEAQKKAAKWDE